ncbi:DNA replication factor Dna2-domain-containing protein [Fimicolochytrium jonesii]|uniref:DNA replication factor Dna2-domain-containing protein n=1 Tax=Fimicolochytrium jonesii TaxID=1396493 RepID=UPI0022FDC6C8|nr:DNA replication factor Dna2-domain-containing protein [Fimicolochytrium jonesii]KAI8816487.1 DNA replication factor Dna2-domain-containing protein [Fimicolochytrium jonesii]
MKKNSTARKTSKQPAAPLKDSASRKPASDAQPLKAGMLQYLKGASSENTESAPPPAKPKDREGATAKMKRRILGLAGGTGNAGQTSTTSTRKALGSMDEKSVNKVLPRSVIVERAVQQPAGPPVVVVVPSQDVQQAGRRTSVDGSKRSNKRPSLPLEDPAVDEGSPKKGRTARSPKKPLKPSDSGFSEETLQPRQSQEASSTSAVSPDLPLTQATPVKKTDQEDRIYWRDSPPSGKLNAAASAIEGRKRDTRAEAKYVASLLAGEKVATPKENSPTLGNKPRHPARSNPELTPSHGKTSYKRSFSLSNLEGSPSALFRNTDPKQIRRERLTHWSTGGKRPNSFSVPGLELFNQPNCSAGPTTLDGRQSGEESCRCSAATTPDSVKRRRLNRSATFPNPSSAWPGSPKGKSSTFDDDNFKENIPPWERQRAQKRLEQAGLLDSNPRHRKDDRLTMKDTRKLQQKQRDTVKVEIEVSDKFSDPDDSDDFACSMALDAFMAEGEVAVVKGESETSTRTHSRANTNVPLVDEPVKSEPQRYTRFLVLEVSWNEYGFPDGPARNKEKKLRLFNEQEQNERFLHLREDWWTTDVNVGDYIHVIGTFDPNLNRCIVDNEKNLVILHPDNLVSATLVAESFDCLRKSILQDRVRSLGESTPPLVYGSLLHCLLQAGLKDGDFSDVRMDDEIDKLVKSSVEDLYAAGEDEEKARQHLKEFVPSLQQWSQMFMRGSPEPDAIVKQHRGDGREKSSLSISKVLDIEDQIWSPMFGIKGNIDASIQINVTEGIFGATRTLAAPFELKTGKSTNVVSHRAQTTLYTLMMGDRYGALVSP